MKMSLSLLFLLSAFAGTVFAQEYKIPPHLEKLPLKLTGSKIFGARPQNPIDFWVRSVGAGPYIFSAKNLPEGVTLDPKTGRIQGKISKVGDYTFDVTLSNGKQTVTAPYQLSIGEVINHTPPMGWNSWYCYSESVSDTKIRDVAKAMRDRGLWAYGWTYVNIDDCWQAEKRGGKFNAIQGNERFPDMKALADAVHDNGSKLGLYSTPFVCTYAGFIGGTEAENGAEKKFYEPVEKRLQKGQVFGRFPAIGQKRLDYVGKVWLFDNDISQWKDWGIDYIKVDWKPNDVPTTARMSKGLRACGRDITLSLSNAAPFENAKGLSHHSQLWRTTGDIHDSWGSIFSNGFIQNNNWREFQRPGAFNDPDMLQIGMIGTPNSFNTQYRPSRLTLNEQKTQFALWCMMSSPLLLSCDIANMDDTTYNILTHDELIEINQDPAAVQCELIKKEGPFYLYKKPLKCGDEVYGIFNVGGTQATYKLDLTNIKGSSIRNVWERKDIDIKPETKELTFSDIPSHSSVILRIKK